VRLLRCLVSFRILYTSIIARVSGYTARKVRGPWCRFLLSGQSAVPRRAILYRLQLIRPRYHTGILLFSLKYRKAMIVPQLRFFAINVHAPQDRILTLRKVPIRVPDRPGDDLIPN
jgi:hypothetical protein